MRILLIKTSSLGDVVHNLPVVTDLRRSYPEAQIDWVVEEGFCEIPRLHPGLNRVIPVALRRWRKALLTPATWGEIRSFRSALQEQSYDLVIDTQGLLKSALIARLARGTRCGYNATAAREAIAARFYDVRFEVGKDLHAVERNRRLVALAAGYSASSAPDYGIAVPPAPTLGGPIAVMSANLSVSAHFSLPFKGRVGEGMGENSAASDPIPLLTSPLKGEEMGKLALMPSAVLLTATSRDDKLWPDEHWIALGRALHQRGLACLLPAGSPAERARAERLAQAIPAAVALPPMSLTELAAQLAAAQIVIGVDTGLVHLAAALGRPTLALFCASDPALTGVYASTPAINLGARGQPPVVEAVLAAATPLF